MPALISLDQSLKGRDLTRVSEWSGEELTQLLDLADDLKLANEQRDDPRLLPGRALGMIFDKASTRTRVSFEVGIWQLGGTALDLDRRNMQLGRGETVRDTAKVLSRYLDAIMIRTFAQADVDEFAEHASIPVINGLTDEAHPCQALADAMTIRERFGSLEGVRVAYLGDGNNVCNSLMVACCRLGASFVAGVPEGYEPAALAVEQAGGDVEITHDPRAAATGADVIYTDVWTSMGHDDERERRLRDLSAYAIDDQAIGLASSRALVMHCLPAHDGEEITNEILYGPRSAAWDQAENRLHAQKALMALVIR